MILFRILNSFTCSIIPSCSLFSLPGGNYSPQERKLCLVTRGDFDPIIYDFDPIIYDFDTIIYDFDPIIYDFDPIIYDFDPIIQD